MPKTKFSIGLDDKLLAEVDRFMALYNLQQMLPMVRAKIIRILIRQGLKHQDIVPSAHIEEDEWLHQADETGKALCGTESKNTTPWASVAAPTCPRCMRLKRHHNLGVGPR